MNKKYNDWRVKYLESLQSTKIIKPRHILANHASRLLLGGGTDFSTEKEKIANFYKEFSKNNKWDQTLNDIVQLGSLEGRVIVGISKVNGKARISIANPNWTNRIAKYFLEEKLAVIYINPIQDDKSIILKELWDTEKVIRSLWNEKTGEEIHLDVINEKLPKNEQIDKVWVHGLGILPLVEFKNKALDPIFYMANTSTPGYPLWDILADDYNVRELADLINLGLTTKSEDTAFNITKIVGLFDINKIKKIKDEGDGLTGYMLDKVVINANKYGEKGGQTQNTILEGNPNLEIYNNSIKRDFELYFEGAGYSTPDQAVMDSATQVLYAKSRDVETTQQKRTLYTEKVLELLDKALMVEGITDKMPVDEDERLYSFSIKNNLQVSETEKLANIQQKLDLGLMSKIEAIMELKGIKKDEAQTELKEINKERDEERERMLEQQKDAMQVSGLISQTRPQANPQAQQNQEGINGETSGKQQGKVKANV